MEGGGDGLQQNFVISFNVICNMTMYWKSWHSTYWPHPQVLGRGVCGKNICYHAAVFVSLFNLICNMTLFLKLLIFLTPRGSVGKIFAIVLLHFVIPINLICNMTMFWKKWILTYEPFPKDREGEVGGLRAKFLLPCCCISWFLLIWYAPEKVEFWPFDA